MDSNVAVALLQEGSKLAGSLIRALGSRPIIENKKEEVSEIQPKPAQPVNNAPVLIRGSGYVEQASHFSYPLPTREQTTYELKRRLAKELYRAELDLANGLMIADRPCDCLSNKHTLGLEAGAEELISQDPDNNVYQEIIQWIADNTYKCTPDAIMSGKYKKEYPHMALQFKEFRKRVLGSSMEPAARPVSSVVDEATVEDEPVEDDGESVEEGEITLEEAEEIAADSARAEVRRRWTAQK
jgi:hypothetical protein